MDWSSWQHIHNWILPLECIDCNLSCSLHKSYHLDSSQEQWKNSLCCLSHTWIYPTTSHSYMVDKVWLMEQLWETMHPLLQWKNQHTTCLSGVIIIIQTKRSKLTLLAHSVLREVEKWGIKIFPPVPVQGSGVIHFVWSLWVCPSVRLC